MTANRADMPTRAVKRASVPVVLAHSSIPGAHDVTLTYTPGSRGCTLTYGLDVKHYYSLPTGLHYFAESVRHAMLCAGLLDD